MWLIASRVTQQCYYSPVATNWRACEPGSEEIFHFGGNFAPKEEISDEEVQMKHRQERKKIGTKLSLPNFLRHY